ncbi:hypothetical protein AAFF_G00287070 [Aldrovandia affinis]|uniref:Uncharacterized protein n=2 Tax=Aldrovandia affinis TaxID=143900 RepID=A0AAD7X242_9TELE|nr:hypothetical protein AAFF_G00287070 [Aldrovandia affinis]
MKTASIGQAIMQATRPKVILAPLQIGLGVQLHHHFASRFLIDTLHQLGFCCSYEEVHRFVNNAVMSHGTDIPGFSGGFVQYAADNVDHNIRTLDGNNTFHGMGMIAAITPATKSSNPILRAKVTRSDMSMVFPEVEFDPKTDTDLHVLFWEFLSRLDQLLPIPGLKQDRTPTVSWLSAAPSVLEECVQSVSNLQQLKTLLQHHRGLGLLDSNATLPSMGDCMLSSLSQPPCRRVVDSTKLADSNIRIHARLFR